METRNPIWRARWIRAVLASLVLATMVLIFLFSAQSGSRSNATSGYLVSGLLDMIAPHYAELDKMSQQAVWDTLQFLVRKLGHFAEFALLGFLIRLLLQTWELKRHSRYAWTAGTLYAVSDEIHQLAVAARSAMWQDVLLDSAGVLAGVILAIGLILLSERSYNENKD